MAMSRKTRALFCNLAAVALGFAAASASTAVLSAARATEPMRAMTPTVWLLSPGSGQAITGNIVVSATASQDTESLQFLLNGTNLGPAISSGACSMNWNTAAVSDGTYTVSVVAFDAIGGSTTSSPATVVVENTPAQITGVATSAITQTSALITWNTNQLSSSGVDYGPGGYVNSTPLDVNLVVQHAQTLVGLTPGTVYHFRVSSWNGVGLLATSPDFTFTTASGAAPGVPSTPQIAQAPTPQSPGVPGGCLTPDPFVAMGGGTCYNGGWLPPGVVQIANPSPSPTPTPVQGGCLTPDPFVAIGGGTCYNGGWLPRGVVTPPAPTPTQTGVVTPTPTPTPTPRTVQGCATADPFAAMGGGTCFNGGWYPPGMLPAQAKVPAPTSTPTPVPANPGSCGTPDPFVGIPGLHGVCVNGGWYPVRSSH